MGAAASAQARALARRVNEFLTSYAPANLTPSEHTLRSYRVTLTLYLGFLERVRRVSPAKLSPKCFEAPVIEEWLSWLASERGCSPRTCNTRLSCLRTFLKYLSRCDAAYAYLESEGSAVKKRKAPQRHVKGMSKAAVEALMASVDQTTRTGRRDMALIVLAYATAARIDELLSMTVSQLHLDGEDPYVLLFGKGQKARVLHLLPKAVAHMRAYLEEFHPGTPDGDAYVFFSRNLGPRGKMSQSAVNKMLRKHAAAAHAICPEVPVGLHAHQLRHAKASHWLEDGMNIVQISLLLGHSSVSTTLVYLDITTESEKAALATLEGEEGAGQVKKWKAPGAASLNAFCGLEDLK